MTSGDPLDSLVEEICAGARYAALDRGLVRRVAAEELTRRRSRKEALKGARTRLHQAGGAYQERGIPYAAMRAELVSLPREPGDPALRAACRDWMQSHASTRERLPVLDRFYAEALAGLGPFASVLDLACGLNPLALGWMPLAPGATYRAVDIYSDLAGFLNEFFIHCGVNGCAEVHDLTAWQPEEPVELAILLKTLPVLEQLEKNITARLLEALPARTALVSFPAHSLGGRSKGMPGFYDRQFRAQVPEERWDVRRMDFPGELVYVLRRREEGIGQ